MTHPIWIVSSNVLQARHWETILTHAGWKASIVAHPEESSGGIVLIDWERLGRHPRKEAAHLKSKMTASLILISEESLSPDDVIEALEGGMDDHFPYSIADKLFIAKLKAHARRQAPVAAPAKALLLSPAKKLRLDSWRRQAWVKNPKGKWSLVKALTPTELEFLTLFLQQPEKVLRRRFLLESVWGNKDSIRPGTVDKHIESLRRKLGRQGSKIETVYGVGYAFRKG